MAEASNAVEILKDSNGVDQVIVLRNGRGFSAQVSLKGGQVLSWNTDRGEELLFKSSKANSQPPAAVRGGIMICFPLFGNGAFLEQHGFAKNRMWAIDNNPSPLQANESSKAYIDLLLTSSANDPAVWGHDFRFCLRVALALDGSLSLTSRVQNISSQPFSFSIAYHTYFPVSDISNVRVEGVETLHYLDNLCDGQRFTAQADALTFESEVDRVYLSSVEEEIAIWDHCHMNIKTFLIKKAGLPDVVVWNPWEKKSKAIADIGNEDYKRMLCVGGAAIEKPIPLKPGQQWTGRLKLSVKRYNKP